MLETKVKAFLHHQGFQLTSKKMVIGVSGGPDSLALLHYLLTEKEKEGISLVVAHVDHMFRGQESYEDALFVRNFCEQHSIPFEMTRVNVPKIMEKTGKSSQIAARDVRYEFFSEIMEKYQYPFLALAHHGDDQMETMLMRVTRGSAGLARAGIPFSRPFHKGTIFRPFLGVERADIVDYCHKHNLSPRIDPSNEKGIYSRNRFRKEVIPFLKKENPLVHEHFQRFSEELTSDETFLQELTIQQMNTVFTKKEESKITIDITRFLEVPLPLQRRGIQLILNYLYKEKPASLSAVHIDQVFFLIQHPQPSGHLDFPNGLKVIRSYYSLSFQFQSVEASSYQFEMTEPGVINLPNGGKISSRYIMGEIPVADGNSALFSINKIKWPIIIRSRKIGDRMTLKGMQGSKKLKAIFIDQKVPVEERNMWPVLTDTKERIIWLPGLKKSSIEGIDYTAQQYILFTYQK
ncbi:tRNA lysidine(34) synthetase TilS [Bacillus sp. sid0103]|uniref:tRNA lysidine(34) synthetase TilS n=1 Tax=Bacillus sp. sid0103 TaxID=2856337 RepID=UPI001C45FF26|nr:tRNA lysidine(34) synthetase TilS [Bacillus sp. sid0103]MBV7509255.1 tRNA lysidine(34) synthetase TilS [Bacillus sp. sid0103]